MTRRIYAGPGSSLRVPASCSFSKIIQKIKWNFIAQLLRGDNVYEGFFIILLQKIDKPPIKVGFGKLWIDLNRLVEIGDRPVILPLFYISPPSVVVGMSEPGVYFNGLTEVRDRSVILGLVQIGRSPVVVSLGKPRIDLNRLRELGDRLAILTDLTVGATPIVVSLGIS